MPTDHISVMLQESLEYLQPEPGGLYIDCTLGMGGHTSALLEASAPNGRVLALDADPEAIAIARERLAAYGDRLTLVHTNFEHLAEVAAQHDVSAVHGVLFDLGVSSRQLGPSGRGFAFRTSEPLDMRMNPSQGETAAELIASMPEKELADLIYQWGEDRASRRIARSIVFHRQKRPILTTDDLVGAIVSAVGGQRGRTHPATRTFQALRIAVNRELEVLPAALLQACSLLRPEGRLVVISFHSLEDRLVKRFFQEHSAAEALPRLEVLTRKPRVPAPAELTANPRARSAKLRAARRIAA